MNERELDEGKHCREGRETSFFFFLLMRSNRRLSLPFWFIFEAKDIYAQNRRTQLRHITTAAIILFFGLFDRVIKFPLQT
jgi:hypothetical protein